MANPNVPRKPGLLRAILDAILGEDDRIGGVSVTRLTTPLTDDGLTVNVESTLNFAEFMDGAADAMFIVGGEIIQASTRTDTTFTGLTRGLQGSGARFHPQGTLVYDFAQNRTALDHVRRGFLLRFASGVDLDVIGRNLGVPKCPGLTDDQWRAIIQLTAYMPKQPLSTFDQILNVIFPGQYEVIKKISEPWTVTVNLAPQTSSTRKGKFFLNGGELQLTTGLTTVVTSQVINNVQSVYLDTPLARRGFPGANLYAGGSFLGSTITLGVSPGPIGTPVIVNYGAFQGHYLAQDADVEEDQDWYAYVSDDSDQVRCLLDIVRAAGIKVKVGIKG